MRTSKLMKSPLTLHYQRTYHLEYVWTGSTTKNLTSLATRSVRKKLGHGTLIIDPTAILLFLHFDMFHPKKYSLRTKLLLHQS